MNLSRPFILRPVATTLLMVAILLAGALAYRLLPVSALPQVDYPIIQVFTFFPGASPDVMASSVTAPLERQFGQMPGLNQMTSTSSSGSSVITLQFTLTLGLDVAEQEVQAAINAALTLLPTDLPNPPVYSKVNPADPPILTLGLTSTTLPLPQVEDLADTRLAQKIAQLPGVGLVSISGGQRPAVRVQANPTALAAYGLTLEDLRTAVAAANVNQAKGSFDGPQQSSTIGANDQLLTSRDYRPLIIAYRNNAPVTLADVADVIDDAENVRQAAWMNDVPAVILNIQRQPGANVIAVVDRIKQLLPQLQASLPASVQVAVLTDRTVTIRGSVEDVQFELMLSVALVVMVIFLFLRNRGGDDHSGRRRTAVAGRHLRRHVALGVQPEQPVVDGADHLHRVRGGRRHRHDREHRPLHRAGRRAAAGCAQGGRADRLHHPVPDHLAHRRAHPAAVHGRRGRPPVPRIRDHPGRHHPALGRRVADADADDVRHAAAPHAPGAAGTVLPLVRATVRPHHRGLRHDLALGAAAPAGDAPGGGGHAGPDGDAIHRGAEGLFPGPGHRA